MTITLTEIGLLNFGTRIVGVTSGCFDLLHFYHLHFLERCRSECDVLIVGVDSDFLIQANKKKSPIIPEYQRTAMVAALRCVDAAFTMRSFADLHRLADISDKVFKNSTRIYGRTIAPKMRRKTVLIPDVDEVTSTSSILHKIRGERKGVL